MHLKLLHVFLNTLYKEKIVILYNVMSVVLLNMLDMEVHYRFTRACTEHYYEPAGSSNVLFLYDNILILSSHLCLHLPLVSVRYAKIGKNMYRKYVYSTRMYSSTPV
jgi:hypothetical protein